jgi:hypothetical protein
VNDNKEREYPSRVDTLRLYSVSPNIICMTLEELFSLSVFPFPEHTK